MINGDVKNRAGHFYSRCQMLPCIKKTVGPAARATHAASIESVTLPRLVGAAWDPFVAGPDWKQSVQSAKAGPENQ